MPDILSAGIFTTTCLHPMCSATALAAVLWRSAIIGTSAVMATALSPRALCAMSISTVLSSPPEKHTAHPSMLERIPFTDSRRSS